VEYLLDYSLNGIEKTERKRRTQRALGDRGESSITAPVTQKLRLKGKAVKGTGHSQCKEKKKGK